MDDLTLERIAKIRADIAEHASDESYWDAREELLNAAERGLTQDRKAAAFDRLAAINELGIQTFGDAKFVYDYSGESSHGPTLLEAIEQLPEVNHESK
jgi:hypothetical protein